MASFQSQLAEVQQENDRLIDLLARMDAVRLQLEKDKKQLVGEVVTLRAAAPEADCTDDAQEQINCLQQKLKLEKEKRQQAEASFQELLSSLDSLGDTGKWRDEDGVCVIESQPSISGRPPSAVGRIKETMDQLERDNSAVRGNLQQTRLRMNAMQSELSKVQPGITKVSSLEK